MTVQIRHLATSQPDFDAAFQQVLHWSVETDSAIEDRVAAILADVRLRGDEAVLELHRSFRSPASGGMADLGWGRPNSGCIRRFASRATLGAGVCAARVRSYHERQKQACGLSWSYRDEDGTLLGQKVTPLDRVGILCARRQGSLPLVCVDERHPLPMWLAWRKSSWSCPPHVARRTPGAGCRLCGGRDPGSLWEAPKPWRFGLWHRHRAQG